MRGLGTGKNIWTGKKITPQDQDEVNSALEKMVPYKIMDKKLRPGEKEHRYHWRPEFMDHLNIMGEIISKNPGLQKVYEGDGSEKADFYFMVSMVTKYLAAQLVMEKRLAGLPEWEKNSTSQVYNYDEINDEEERFMHRIRDEEFNEIWEITRMVYGLLRYETKMYPEMFIECK